MRRLGRPRKLRRKGPYELINGGVVSRKGTIAHCSNCHKPGHNVKTCKKPKQDVYARIVNFDTPTINYATSRTTMDSGGIPLISKNCSATVGTSITGRIAKSRGRERNNGERTSSRGGGRGKRWRDAYGRCPPPLFGYGN